jgi:hypothetical protein
MLSTLSSARETSDGWWRVTIIALVAEYQVTSWRELPSLVVVRDGDQTTKTPLPARFQEAIDEAAMRLGDTSSDAYLEGWMRGEWVAAGGTTAEVAERVVTELETTWSPEAVTAFLDNLAELSE